MTKCKLIKDKTCHFAITLTRNPAVSLQSVSFSIIVHEHTHFDSDKKNARPKKSRGTTFKQQSYFVNLYSKSRCVSGPHQSFHDCQRR